MPDPPSYEVAVVGGGPAGLTTGIYTTRLGHRTAVFEKEGGRHAMATHVHNLFGVSEDVSGAELAELATRQLEEYGGEFYPDAVDAVRRRDEDGFRIEAARSTVDAERVIFATGFSDLRPDVSDLRRFTGHGLHYCLHCDAYALGDQPVFVLGHDEEAARVAMTVLNFTDDVDLLLDGRDPTWDEETDEQFRAHPIDRVDPEVVSVVPDDEDAAEPWIEGFSFADGTEREYVGGFAMYGIEYNAGLADDLGCDLTDEGAIAVDENRETSVDGAYAVGDVTHGQNQTTIAIGDAAYAGIAIHKDLRRFPVPLEEIDDEALDAPGAPADVRARMRRNRERDGHAGLREPTPDE